MKIRSAPESAQASAVSGIQYWNRARGVYETEKVYGAEWLAWTYESRFGHWLEKNLLSRPWISQVYGAYQSSARSARKIPSFVEQYEIPMEDYAAGPFRSFNDFFIRQFRPGKREFVSAPNVLPAPAEARYLAFASIREEQTFPVKGGFLTAEGILGSSEKAKPFIGGPLFIARLCPVDYHRYHYPDAGRTLDAYPVRGAYHSVNPVALRAQPDIFVVNERRVSILETENFGKLAYIEVGALCVGKIVQTHDETKPFRRGEEKGYFLFGGSTVILLAEPGRILPSADLLENSAHGKEVLVQIGQAIAERV